VEVVHYCNATYRVKLRDGSVREFREFDLRLKTDSSPNGPGPGTPALIRAGMAGDRAFLIFAAPEEMTVFIKRAC
jgi:cytochrome c